MNRALRIGLIGDYNAAVFAHRAIPVALELAQSALRIPLQLQWLATDAIDSSRAVAAFDGLWCVPGSPYRSLRGALTAIRHAREARVPFLGSCGGFQHAVLEYARNVLAWADAEHAETAPQAQRAVIAPLACSLVEVEEAVMLMAGSRLAAAYGSLSVSEGYHCNYGINEAFRAQLTSGPLRVSAVDGRGDVRAIELDGHPFFVATLFQPERAALRGQLPPLVRAFIESVSKGSS